MKVDGAVSANESKTLYVLLLFDTSRERDLPAFVYVYSHPLGPDPS